MAKHSDEIELNVCHQTVTRPQAMGPSCLMPVWLPAQSVAAAAVTLLAPSCFASGRAGGCAAEPVPAQHGKQGKNILVQGQTDANVKTPGCMEQRMTP